MDSLARATLQNSCQPLFLSLDRLPSFTKPVSSLSFKFRINAGTATGSFEPFSIRAACSSSQSNFDSFSVTSEVYARSVIKNQTLLSSSILKTTCVTIAAAAAFFFTRLCGKPPAIAAQVLPTTKESTHRDSEASHIGESANKHNDIEALRSLVQVKVKARKFPEAMEILDRLIELEPNEFEWLLLKANIHFYMGNSELCRNEFEGILAKDPLKVEAYHGLVMLTETSDTNGLKGILVRVEEALENCKKHKGKSEVRDFKLLIAQIKVMEGSYLEALKLYQELEREEPKDFRPHLCLGIIYTILRENEEADRQFAIFRRLVPKSNPYKEYFDESMSANQHFVQQVEK